MTTGIHKRFQEVSRSRTFLRIVRTFGLSEKKVLDIGSGYGEYLAHFGAGSIGLTTSSEETAEGKSRGLDIRLGNAEFLRELPLPAPFEAIWANNFFEHILSPHAFLMNARALADDRTILILGVPVVPKMKFLFCFPKFRGALASNHLNFFTAQTLRLSVERAGWRVEAIRSFVFPVFFEKVLNDLAPHLYVVARKDADFKYPEKKCREWEGDPHYRDLLKMGGGSAT